MKNRKVAIVNNNHWYFKRALNSLIGNAKNNISKLLTIINSMVTYDFNKKKF